MTKLNTLTKLLTAISITSIIAITAINAQEAEVQAKNQYQNKKQMKKKFTDKRKKMQSIFNQLELTPEQRVTLRENRKAIRQKRKAQKIQHKRSRDISQFITVDGVDRTAMIADATANITKRVNLRADAMEATLRVLTPQQKTKFVELLQAKNK